MKVSKKILAVALTLAMVLGLTGCGKKVTDKKGFKEAIKSEDYDTDRISESDGDKHIKKSYSFYEDGISASLIIFKDKGDAEDYFDDLYDELKEKKDDGDFEGTLKKSGTFFPWSTPTIKIDGEYTAKKNSTEVYGYMFLNGDVIVMVSANDNGKTAVKDVKALVKALGY
ncbi:MAG: hypothetical protein IK020_12155 [Clostridiales bacterium]|nr:hypothetical protein [Clostridiales bacterium]